MLVVSILQANIGDGKAPLGLLWPLVMRMLPNSGARRRRGEAVPTLQREGIDLLALLPEREGTCRQHSSFFRNCVFRYLVLAYIWPRDMIKLRAGADLDRQKNK